MDQQGYLPGEDHLRSVLKTELRDLPTFPVIVTRLLELTQDQSSKIGDLVRVVETDPAITARLLRIANSPYYSFQRQISTVRESVILLGYNEVRRLALNLTIHKNLVDSGQGESFDQQHFWRHSLAVAIIAKRLADETKLVDPEEAYAAGLLHDIGKTLLEHHGKISYSEFLEFVDDQPSVVLEEEQRIFGESHETIGALYASYCALPETLVNAILFHHRMVPADLDQQSTQLVAIIALADFIAWGHGFGSVKKARSMRLAPYIQKIIDITKLNLTRLVTQMDEEINAAAKIYHFNFPEAFEFRESLLRISLDLVMSDSQSYFIDTEPSSKGGDSAADPSLMLIPHRSLERSEIIGNTLIGLVKALELQQLALLLIDSGARKLILHSACVTGEPHCRDHQTTFDLDGSGAILGAIRERQVKALYGDCEAERRLLTLLQTEALDLIPITGQHHVVGMFALGRSPSVDPSSELVDTLVKVGHELGLALEHAKLLADSRDKAERDGLTGLPNRMMIDRVLADELRQAQEQDQVLAVVMIDIDWFKKFNDRFGHTTGDAVLKLVGKLLRQHSREGSFVGRYGGEEFCAILPGVSPEQAHQYAERLRQSVEKIGRSLSNALRGSA